MKRSNGIYSDLIDMTEEELKIHAELVASKKAGAQKHLKAMIRNIELMEAEQKAVAAILKSKVSEQQATPITDVTYSTCFQFPERPTKIHKTSKSRDPSVTFDETL